MEQNRGPGDDSGELRLLRERLRPGPAPASERAATVKWRSIGVPILLVLLPLALWLTVDWHPVLRFFLVLVWTLLFLIVPGASPFPLLRRGGASAASVEQEALHALEEIDNPRAIGMLIDAEGESTGERQKAILAALTRLLPRAREIGGSLTDSQIERLYTHLDALAKLARYTERPTSFSPYPLGGTWERPRVINQEFPELRDEYEAFLLALLAGLEALGTADTIRHIEPIVSNKAPSEQYARIEQAAWQTLDAIHARMEAEREGRTLLRPASEPTNSLVRPAGGPAEAAPESLLRPSDGA
jgi:hypothetical protein